MSKEKERNNKAEEQVDKKIRYREGIIKTFVASVFGIIAGAISFALTGQERSRDVFAILILFFFIYIQKYFLGKFGVKTDEMGGKDWFYVGFITFDLWYVSWVILLNP
jgi:hypothetical protein